MNVVVVDNGGGNVASIGYALERLGVTAEVSVDAARVATASHIILPGVGAAADAMARLKASGVDQVLKSARQPLLGICLGMQLLHVYSEEGAVDCLGLMPGVVRRLRGPMPVPHMGWNRLTVDQPHPLLEGLERDTYLYFVHSYAAAPDGYTAAHADYGQPIAAVVSRENFHGVQFHPERSAAAGARLLANFLAMGS